MTVVRLEDPHVAVLIDSLLITREKIEGEGRTAPTLREASNKICDLVDPATEGLYVSTGDPKVLSDGIRRALLELTDDLSHSVVKGPRAVAILTRVLREYEGTR